MKRWESIFWQLLVASIVLAVWQIGVTATHTQVFPSPISVLRRNAKTPRTGWRLTK